MHSSVSLSPSPATCVAVRGSADLWSTHEGRSPDLRVWAGLGPSRPAVQISGLSQWLAAHSCGGSSGFGAFWLHLTGFPFHPKALGFSGTIDRLLFSHLGPICQSCSTDAGGPKTAPFLLLCGAALVKVAQRFGSATISQLSGRFPDRYPLGGRRG